MIALERRVYRLFFFVSFVLAPVLWYAIPQISDVSFNNINRVLLSVAIPLLISLALTFKGLSQYKRLRWLGYIPYLTVVYLIYAWAAGDAD